MPRRVAGDPALVSALPRLLELENIASGVLLTNGGRYPASKVVVAAGTGSRRLFEQLAADIPLIGIAGYQTVRPDPGVEIRHSVIYQRSWSVDFSPAAANLQELFLSLAGTVAAV